MDYSLAKELKEAGFPQHANKPSYMGSRLMAVNSDNTDYAFPPTLEELIEACGEAYFNLQYITTDDEGWMASKYPGQPGKYKSVGYCRTPTEAVARLWLALNRSSTEEV